MGMPVSSRRRSSSPRRRAPPPVRAIPRSMTSPASSGGHLSRVVLTASMISASGSSMARRISSAEITMVFGSPLTRSRPRISALGSSAEGYADPSAILISSAVRSPSISEYSFLPKVMMAWSSSSPPIRIDCEVTMPPSEMTATRGAPPAEVHHHVAGRLVDRQPGPDRRGHGLLDDVDAPRARLVAGLLHRALFDAGDAARHRDNNARFGQVTAFVHLLDE